ncbi:recombinase family protein [Streptomyces sp. NPDC006283]|uniref:recombinase family protein n=1 Tax=Streptomyces sp. NPDC006283 TaxID=3156741 RepID=UPI0033BD2DB9
MVAELRDRGIGFLTPREPGTTTPGGRLVFHVFAALAEFIRELIVIGTNEGLAAARGRVGGRPSVATEEVIKAARDLLPDPGRSITSIAKLLGVSPGTLYNHIPDLRELRAGTVPRQLEASSKWPNPSKINLSGTFCTATTHTRRGPWVQGNRSLFSGNSRVGPCVSAWRIRGFGGNLGVGCEAAGFGCDLGIDLVHGSAVFEDVVLVVEFGEALGQEQLMSVALVNPEGELPRCELSGEHAACEGSRGGFLTRLAADRIEGEAEFVECCGKQVVDVVVRFGARAGGEDAKAGGVESGDERITGGVHDIARADFPHAPEGGMVL